MERGLKYVREVRRASFTQWWEKSGMVEDSRSGETRDSRSGGRTFVCLSLGLVGDSRADEQPSKLRRDGRVVGRLGVVGIMDGRLELSVKTVKKVSKLKCGGRSTGRR